MIPGELPEGVIVRLAQSPAEVTGALECEYLTFWEAGYIESNPAQEVMEYSPFNSASSFFVIIDTGSVVGALRRIPVTPELGLKTLNDFEVGPNWREVLETALSQDPNSVEEIGTVGVLKEYRQIGGHAFASSLYRASWQDSVRRGVGYWVCSVDERLYHMVERVYRFNIAPIGPKVYYMGSMTVPAVIPILELRSLWENGFNPNIGSFFLKGL